jgi:hypothetical protein
MPLLTLSGMIAALGFGMGPLRSIIAVNPAAPTPAVVSFCIWIAWVWLAVFVVSVFMLRVRSLWLLLEAPFVLYFPWTFVAHGVCSLAGHCHGLVT